MPVTMLRGPQGCETSRLPHFLDNRLTDGVQDISLKHRSLFTPQEDSWYSFLLEADPKAIVRLEGSGKLKASNDLIRNRTRDLPACSIMPQQT
jgi:hypothetical protein